MKKKKESRRINVSISEEDYQFIKDFKHLFNISEVCRDAIKDRVRELDAEIKEFEEWRKSRS